MMQNDVSPVTGSRKNRKRVGRGDASGHGSYSGKGMKGQKARSGPKMRPGFEGGQLPLIKRLPAKHGFTNRSRVEYSVVNLTTLNRFESGSEVTPEILFAAHLVKSLKQPVKILAEGDLSHPLTIKANKFSAAAKTKVEAAGGKIEEI